MTAELIALPPDDVLQQALQDAPAQADLLHQPAVDSDVEVLEQPGLPQGDVARQLGGGEQGELAIKAACRSMPTKEPS